MKKLILLFFAAAAAIAQPPITGTNPTISCTNCGLVGTFHLGNVQGFSGPGNPGSITGAVYSDLYVDVIAHQAYICVSTSCSAVGATNWQPIANAQNLQVVSVRVFGVDGSGTDAGNFQNALNTMAGVGCLYIPYGTTVAIGSASISIPSNTCLKGDGNASIINADGLATAGVGVLDIVANATNIDIGGIFIEGNVLAPALYAYSVASANGPQYMNFTTRSTFWIHGPAGAAATNQGIRLHDLTINHTGGYAIYGDASTGSVQNLNISNIIVQNSRSSLFGLTGSVGDALYGSWTGGILFQGPGATYNFQNITLDGNKFQNVTGNALWSHSIASSLLNTNFRVTNNTFIDTGLDSIQINTTDGLVETGNKSYRNGYVVTSDVGSTRVGGPKWDQNGACPSAFDGGIGVTNGVRTNNMSDSFNGCFMDGDGTQNTIIANNDGVSCFSSLDPLSDLNSCGPYLNPTTKVNVTDNNYARGITINNSIGFPGGGNNLTITGNNITGAGGGSIVAFSTRYSNISNNTIYQLGGPLAHGNPIILGNIGTSANEHANNNYVTGNLIWWVPGSGAPAVLQDGATFSAPFFSSDVNIVKNNVLMPNSSLAYEFGKCPGLGGCGAADPSASGTGPLVLSSVTAGADSVTNAILQVEGGTANPTLGIYMDNGVGASVARLNLGGLLIGPVTFSILPAAVTFPYFTIACSNCTAGSSPCTSGGTGALAYSNGGTWDCLGAGGGSGITGSGTANEIAMFTGTSTIGNSGINMSGGILYTPSGIISSSGIQATGFNPAGFTGSSSNVQIGCTISAGNCVGVYFAVPGGGALPCPAGGPSNCTYYTSFTTHGGVLTSLP